MKRESMTKSKPRGVCRGFSSVRGLLLNRQNRNAPQTVGGITVPAGRSCRHPTTCVVVPPATVIFAWAIASPALQPEIVELASAGQVTLPVRTVPCLLVPVKKRKLQFPPTTVTELLNAGCP